MDSRTRRKAWLLFGFLSGILFIVVGILSYLAISDEIFEDPISTEGTISGTFINEIEPDVFIQQDAKKFAPKVVFQTKTGDEFEFVDFSKSDDIQTYSLGDKVPVVYDANDPSKAIINAEPSFWGLPAFAIGTGILIILIAIGIFKL